MTGHKRDRFRVSFGFEPNPVFGQFSAQFTEVFDNPVVNHCDRTRFMRMRVQDGWTAMGGPAGVPDP